MEELAYSLNTFYYIMMGALVMWMAAGFTMLEAGLVRKKNTAEIVTKNIGLYSIACTMFMLCGYAALYASAGNGVLPVFTLEWMNTEPGGTGIEGYEDDGTPYAANASDFFFQVVFVATAVSIVSGAVAERMNQWPFFALAAFIAGFVYPVQGYWNWGGGFLSSDYGYADYAGSGTVHLLGASCALAAAIFIGPRIGKYGKETGKFYGLFPKAKTNKLYGSNLPAAALGTFILWLGWFGFNGGSALAMDNAAIANEVANVVMNTNAAAAGGVIACLVVARVFFKKTNLLYALNGAIGGLVAITASPATPTGLEATVIGACGGLLCYGSLVAYEQFFKVDDPVGAISAHGTAGVFGIMVVPMTNDGATFAGQATGALAIAAWGFVLTFVFLYLLNFLVAVAASEEIQKKGLDAEEIGVEAYPEF
jgi:Amt family ammonium transporter